MGSPRSVLESTYQVECNCGLRVEKIRAEIPDSCPRCGATWVLIWSDSNVYISTKGLNKT